MGGRTAFARCQIPLLEQSAYRSQKALLLGSIGPIDRRRLRLRQPAGMQNRCFVPVGRFVIRYRPSFAAEVSAVNAPVRAPFEHEMRR